MSINEQVDNLIATARALKLTVDDVTDEILIRWGPAGETQVIKLDEYGRHYIAGSKHLFLSPLPVLLGMKLSEKQLNNIMPNCGVDKDGNEVAAAFRGFTDETGGNQKVAYLTARRYEKDLKPGDTPPAFQPRTFCSRFRSIDEAVAYVAANPWVQ